QDQEIARTALRRLTAGERLDAVIDRAADGGADAERAANVLAQLGEDGIRALAVCALTEADPERAERLASRLLAQGPAAAQAPVLERLASPERETARRAIRLAERIGTNDAVARIADLLRSEDAFVREAAGAALARLGQPEGADDAQALRALVRALAAADPQLPPLAIECLAATKSPRAVPALASALHAAIEARELENSRDLIRALGELGRPEASTELGKVVLRRDLLGRKRLRELKMAAIRALGQLPGDDAVGVLSQAARLRDTQLRDAAQTALERRSR
ncbi:MAG: HEAT repeat domain-containing protein, partial [Deltaproteobacteria bacterium]|nr:HEAT repeat domain-containing protein [Deltaproteobacteria bacterium]